MRNSVTCWPDKNETTSCLGTPVLGLFRWFLFCFHWLSNCCFYWSILRKERRFQTTRNWWRRSDRGPVTFTTPSGCLLLLVSFLFFSFFVNSSCYLIRWRSGGLFVFRRPPSMSGRCRRRSKIVAQHDVDETVFHQGHEDESAKKKTKKNKRSWVYDSTRVWHGIDLLDFFVSNKENKNEKQNQMEIGSINRPKRRTKGNPVLIRNKKTWPEIDARGGLFSLINNERCPSKKKWKKNGS